MPRADNSVKRVIPETIFDKNFCKIDLSQSDYYPAWIYPDSNSIDDITSNYTSEFSVRLDDGQFTDVGGFNLIPFDDSVCGFFNRDLAHSMAEAQMGHER